MPVTDFRMPRWVYPVLFSLAVTSLNSWGSMNYVGSTSSEFQMEFDAFVIFASDHFPRAEDIRNAISVQNHYAVGPARLGKGGAVVIPRMEYGIHLTDINLTPDGLHYRADYHYLGTALVENNGRSTFTHYLPVSTPEIDANRIRYCHHYGHGAPWLYWSPRCPGQLANRDYLAISVPIRRLENTTNTFPEYSRLIRPDSTLEITALYGTQEEGSPRQTDPYKPAYLNVQVWLTKNGYRRIPVTDLDIASALSIPLGHSLPLMSRYEKQTGTTRLIVKLFFGNTNIAGNSHAFHNAFKTALEESSVVAYTGHAGVGKNLDLERIEKLRNFSIQIPKDRYQIFFWDACLSYAYYPTAYFQRKSSPSDPLGTKNLDQVAAGAETFLDDSALELVKMIDRWATGNPSGLSYQSLSAKLPQFLMGVMGDEDNRAAPTRAD